MSELNQGYLLPFKGLKGRQWLQGAGMTKLYTRYVHLQKVVNSVRK